jgi:hypothetical protein
MNRLVPTTTLAAVAIRHHAGAGKEPGMSGKKKFLDTDEAATEQFDTEGHGRSRVIDDESVADGLRPRIEPEGDDDEPTTLSLRRMARR